MGGGVGRYKSNAWRLYAHVHKTHRAINSLLPHKFCPAGADIGAASCACTRPRPAAAAAIGRGTGAMQHAMKLKRGFTEEEEEMR